MSNVSNAHNIQSYTSGLSKALTGQRMSVHHWKQNKETGVKRESKFVSLPLVASADVHANIESLMPHFVVYLQDVQDKIIREKLEANEACSFVSDADIGMEACIDFLNSSNESGRLTKEAVIEWFNASIADMLALAIAERMGIADNPTDEQSAKVFKIQEAYRNKIASLAGGKTQLNEQEAKQVLKALELAEDDDAMAIRFKARVQKMLEKKQEMSMLDVF